MTTAQEIVEEMAMEFFGMTMAEAHAKGICLECKQPALPRCYSAAGVKEYQLSGLCEICFDLATNLDGYDSNADD